MEEREKRTYEFLDKLGIKYERYEHGPVMTARSGMRFP